MKTNVQAFDELVGDIEGKSILIIGETGHGKTSLLATLAYSMSKDHKVLYMTNHNDSAVKATSKCISKGERLDNLLFVMGSLQTPDRWNDIWRGRDVEVAIFDDIDLNRFSLNSVPRARTVLASCRIKTDTSNMSMMPMLPMQGSFLDVAYFDIIIGVSLGKNRRDCLELHLLKHRTHIAVGQMNKALIDIGCNREQSVEDIDIDDAIDCLIKQMDELVLL